MNLTQTWANGRGAEIRLTVNTLTRVDALTYKNELSRVIASIEDLLITINREDQK